jgi:hypothetical protein
MLSCVHEYLHCSAAVIWFPGRQRATTCGSLIPHVLPTAVRVNSFSPLPAGSDPTLGVQLGTERQLVVLVLDSIATQAVEIERFCARPDEIKKKLTIRNRPMESKIAKPVGVS